MVLRIRKDEGKNRKQRKNKTIVKRNEERKGGERSVRKLRIDKIGGKTKRRRERKEENRAGHNKGK